MAVKIRLTRRGRKKLALYDMIVADVRSPRDGRFIEKLGTYNPNTDPATINIDDDRAFHWVMVGAQPTDTARRILSYRGILLRKHLQMGVQKGAITQEEADKRYTEWIDQKTEQIQTKKDKLAKAAKDGATARMEAERKIKEARAEAIAKKNVVVEEVAEEVAEEASADATEEATAETEEASAATTEEAVTEETPEAEAKEAPDTEEVVEEPASEESAPQAVAEDAPAEDAPAEESPEATTVEAPAEEATTEEAPEAKTEEAPTEEVVEEAPEAAAEEAEAPEAKTEEAPSEEAASDTSEEEEKK